MTLESIQVCFFTYFFFLKGINQEEHVNVIEIVLIHSFILFNSFLLFIFLHKRIELRDGEFDSIQIVSQFFALCSFINLQFI